MWLWEWLTKNLLAHELGDMSCSFSLLAVKQEGQDFAESLQQTEEFLICKIVGTSHCPNMLALLLE